MPYSQTQMQTQTSPEKDEHLDFIRFIYTKSPCTGNIDWMTIGNQDPEKINNDKKH